MEYGLINPSDPYTFLADDLEVAALVVFSVSTLYGAEPKDNGEGIPVFCSEEWYKDRFGRSPADGLKEKKKELAEALESMMYGGFEDRKRYEIALAAITDPNKRKNFIDAWQDGHSSLNDIGTYCHQLAEKIKSCDYMEE